MRLTGAAIAAILTLGMMATGEAWTAGAENIATPRQNTQTTSATTIRDYIENSMPAGTPVAICLLSGGLQILQGFTSNGWTAAGI